MTTVEEVGVERMGDHTGSFMFNPEVEHVTPSHILLARMLSHGLNPPVTESEKHSFPLCLEKKKLIGKHLTTDRTTYKWAVPCFYLNIICYLGQFKELFIVQPIGFHNPDLFLMAKIARTWCMEVHTHTSSLSSLSPLLSFC